MFDTKPLERSLDFRHKLRQRNSELADKYESYLSAKRSWYTAEDGFYQDNLEKTIKYIKGEIGKGFNELILELVAYQITHRSAQVWVKQKSKYGNEMPPESPLGSLGIRTLEDFAKKVVDSVAQGLDTPWDKFEDASDLRKCPKEFYLKHFKRLERERLTGTPISEGVFLPYIRKIFRNSLNGLFMELHDYLEYDPITEGILEDDFHEEGVSKEEGNENHTLDAIIGIADINFRNFSHPEDAEGSLREIETHVKKKCWEGEYLEKEFRKLKDDKTADEVNDDFLRFRFAKEMLLLFRRHRGELEGAEEILREAYVIGIEELKQAYAKILNYFASKPGYYDAFETEF